MEENFNNISDRLLKVLKDNNLVKLNGEVNYAEAERKAGLTGGLLSKAVSRNGGLSGENKSKFLRHFQVRNEWFMTGKGEIYDKKLTPVGESSKRNDQMSSDEVLKALGSIVEDSTDYKLVPSTLLNGEYRIVLAKEIDQRDQLLKEILKDKNLLIETLKEEIQELRSRKSSQKTH
jgi:hypothetical protein